MLHLCLRALLVGCGGGQLLRQQGQCAFFIGVLTAFAFHAHRQAAGQMGGTHGAFGFVHMLATFAAGAASLQTHGAIIRQRRHIRQAEHADIPVFARMFWPQGAGANPLHRAQPAFGQGFGSGAV